ncbi:MAG: MFS transporter [Hyphomonadaceae bacterium]|nr:MFS transporter [Hyphomonadaceae bacterium]
MSEQPILSSRAARVTMVMSALFGTTGVILVFLPRWLEVERALTGAEIGAVLSLAQFARIVTGPAIAYWADGARDRGAPLKLVSAAALLSYAAFFFLAQGFWQLLAFGFVALSLTQALNPLIEAATLRATAHGKLSYGVARGVGSAAFIVANIAGGALISRFGLDAVVVWVLCGLALTAAASWLGLKRDAPEPHGRAARTGAFSHLLRNRRFLTLILACGLIQSAHGFYYGFSTIVWRGQGLSPEMVGVLWAFGVAIEIGFLFSLPAVERRVTPEALILMGAGGAVARWIAMGFAPLGLVLWPLQALHALSFAAAHVGAMRLIHREAPEHAATMAQTLYAALSAGVLMGCSTLLSGYLYDHVGARGYWSMAILAAAGGALAVLLLQPKPRASAPPR